MNIQSSVSLPASSQSVFWWRCLAVEKTRIHQLNVVVSLRLPALKDDLLFPTTSWLRGHCSPWSNHSWNWSLYFWALYYQCDQDVQIYSCWIQREESPRARGWRGGGPRSCGSWSLIHLTDGWRRGSSERRLHRPPNEVRCFCADSAWCFTSTYLHKPFTVLRVKGKSPLCAPHHKSLTCLIENKLQLETTIWL